MSEALKENLEALDRRADPVAWNMNRGMLDIAEKLTEALQLLRAQQRQIDQLQAELQRLQPR